MVRSNSFRRMLVAATMAIVMSAGAWQAARGDESGVGVVAEYRPAAGRFVFSRPPRGEPVPVQIGAVVVAGDSVTLPAGASLSVQLASGETKKFAGPGKFEIPSARPLGTLAAIFLSLPDLFDDEFRLAGTAASRGGEPCTDGGATRAIDVPILVPGARIVSGQRDLPLAWYGGCPPFVVQVLAGANRLVHRESIDGWQVRLDDVPLVPGQYSVVVTDAAGKQFSGTLEAVGAAPAMPADIAADDSKLGITAQAVWLAGVDGGRWRLESFERLRPLIRAGDPLAGSIGDGVLWGPAPR